MLKDNEKIPALYDELHKASSFKTIVFCNNIHTIETVASTVRSVREDVYVIHGKIPPKKRSQILAKFISHNNSILFASDIYSRGLDLPEVSCVINYDMPTTIQSYIHRIGRTGRFGKKGISVSFL